MITPPLVRRRRLALALAAMLSLGLAGCAAAAGPFPLIAACALALAAGGALLATSSVSPPAVAGAPMPPPECTGTWHHPTNYTGPNPNPSYVQCFDDRCAIGGPPAACYPTKAEHGKKACPGEWTEVCVKGRLRERCLPQSTPTNVRVYPSKTFTRCGGDVCLPGTRPVHECP